jgi:hypothetical protein
MRKLLRKEGRKIEIMNILTLFRLAVVLLFVAALMPRALSQKQEGAGEQKPQPISPCGPIFFPFNSQRVNCEHKACLDEIALRLQQDPKAKLVMDSHQDSSERRPISACRTRRPFYYFPNEKGVSTDRFIVRDFGDLCSHESDDVNLNRRIEFWILPEGASISDIGSIKKCANNMTPQAKPPSLCPPNEPMGGSCGGDDSGDSLPKQKPPQRKPRRP